MAAVDLWLCSSEPVPEVEEVLEASRIAVRHLRDPKAANQRLRGAPVIVAGRLGPYSAEQAAQLLAELGAKVVLLQASLDGPVVRKAWRGGIAEVLFVPTELPQLPNALHRLLNDGIAPRRCRVAVAGVHGGAGSTLVAAGLAAAAAMQGRRTVLISWCIGWKDAATLLGASPDRDLSELSDVMAELNPQHLRDVANPALPGLDLLLGQPVAPGVAPWADETLPALTAQASLAWDLVVVDAGDVRRPGLASALYDVEACWLVVPAAVASLRMAHEILGMDLGQLLQRVSIVLNRCGARNSVSNRLARERLPLPLVSEIGEASDALDNRWLRGQQFTARPKGALMRDCWELATKLPK